MKNEWSKNIVVYGGAFTPPTIGHHAIVQALLTKIQPDKLLIVPSGPRIDKEYAFQKDVRRRLVEVFAQEFGDSRVETDFTFLEWSDETTTLGIDRYYRNQFGFSPTQVFGADVTTSMPLWPNTDDDRRYLLGDLPKIFLTRKWVLLDLEGKGNYALLDADIPEASSTAVRERWRVDLLTTKVREAYEQLIIKN